MLAAAALPAMVVLLLYAWRPFRLGFYSDDWLVFLHPEYGSFRSWSDLYAMYQNRPVAGLVAWLAQLAIGGDPARAQIVSTLLVITAAIPLGWLTYLFAGLLSARHEARLWGACLAVAVYLAFPWTLGFSAWATAATAAAPATFLFCLAACLLVGPGAWRLSTQISASLLMGASFLTYESFYGQFILVLALAAVMSPLRRSHWTMLRPAFMLGIVNVACFLYNRLAEGNRKTFSEYWYQTFLNGYYYYFWPNLLRSFRGTAPIVATCLIMALSLGIFLLARALGPRRTVLTLLTIMAGIWAAGLFYAIAGYGLTTVGTFARVTVVLSCYGALLLGLLGATAAGRLDRERWLARWQIVASVVLLAALGGASAYRLADWARSWNVQQEVLRQFPDVTRSLVSPDIAFLYVGPFGPPDVPIATAPWEIPGTIAYAMSKDQPAAARQLLADIWSGPGRRWLAGSPDWSTSFDGETVSQHLCYNPAAAYSLMAKELWVWRVGQPQLELAPKGFHVGCNDPGVLN